MVMVCDVKSLIVKLKFYKEDSYLDVFKDFLTTNMI